jgi:magnesium chelatase accessory protein
MALDWSRDGKGWPNRAHSRFAEATGLRWHVQRAGQGGAVLLLHGTGASTHSWAGLLPMLAEDREVLAMDLPGHGFTPAPPGFRPRVEAMAEAVAGLCEAEDFVPGLIIGHSAGAAIAIQMALDGTARPDRIVSINGALRPFEGMAGQVFPAMAKLLHYNPLTARMFAWGAGRQERVERLIGQTGSDITEPYLDFYARLLADRDHVAGALAMMAHWDLAGFARRLSRLEVPALFLAGEADRAVPPEDADWAAKAVQDGAAARLDGLGHLAHEEAPGQVLQAIFTAHAD